MKAGRIERAAARIRVMALPFRDGGGLVRRADRDFALSDLIGALRRRRRYVSLASDDAESAATFDACRAVVDAVWPEQGERFLRHASEPRADDGRLVAACLLLAEADGVAAGSCLVAPSFASSRIAELTWLAVRPDHRRRGIGAGLVRAALEIARLARASLLFATETPAFHASLGIRPVARYGDGRFLFLAPEAPEGARPP